MKTALIIIAQEGYQDLELAGTRKGLTDAGFSIVIASTQAGPCHGKFGGEEVATVALADVQVDDYDRIAFIGGPGAAALADDASAQRIARATAAAGIPLGAICIAPTILAKAGVLQGKQATVWDAEGAQKALLEASGAVYTGDPVTVDGRILTGNGPAAAEAFGEAFAAL